MKKILKAILSFFEAMAQARAAAVLTRAGQVEQAKKLYQKY
jgi:hypothetical protein